MGIKLPRLLVGGWVLGAESVRVIEATGSVAEHDLVRIGLDQFATPAGEPLTLPAVTTWVEVTPALFHNKWHDALQVGMRLQFLAEWQVWRVLTEPQLNAVADAYAQGRRMIARQWQGWLDQQASHAQSWPTWRRQLQALNTAYLAKQLPNLATLFDRQARIVAAGPPWLQRRVRHLQAQSQHRWSQLEVALDSLAPRRFLLADPRRVKETFAAHVPGVAVQHADPARLAEAAYRHQLVRELSAAAASWANTSTPLYPAALPDSIPAPHWTAAAPISWWPG